MREEVLYNPVWYVKKSFAQPSLSLVRFLSTLQCAQLTGYRVHRTRTPYVRVYHPTYIIVYGIRIEYYFCIFYKDVCIRTQGAALASKRATN
jgi:hypothetical protein